jgi:hypothetical protein
MHTRAADRGNESGASNEQARVLSTILRTLQSLLGVLQDTYVTARPLSDNLYSVLTKVLKGKLRTCDLTDYLKALGHCCLRYLGCLGCYEGWWVRCGFRT